MTVIVNDGAGSIRFSENALDRDVDEHLAGQRVELSFASPHAHDHADAGSGEGNGHVQGGDQIVPQEVSCPGRYRNRRKPAIIARPTLKTQT